MNTYKNLFPTVLFGFVSGGRGSVNIPDTQPIMALNNLAAAREFHSF